MKKLLPLVLFIASYTGMDAQPLPAAYVQTTIVSGLQYPTAFDWTPDGRYIVTLKGGNSSGSCANGKILTYSSTGTLLATFYDLTDSVNCDFERGLLGVAVDPDFITNHYVYAYYVHKYGAANNIRVLRFTEVANIGTSPTAVLDINLNTLPFTPAGNHFGGTIGFRPSDNNKLYIEIGDVAYTPSNPTTNLANKLNGPYGKILRINKDGTIPTDNPFYDDGNVLTGNDDRIWSYGHRNMFGMCFNPVTDSMYITENGWNKWDEFNVIHKGRDYGWATCEGDYMNSSTTTPCSLVGAVSPIATWGTPLPAITGCLYYSGTAMPEFNNHILVADNDNGILYDMTMGNAPAYDIVTSKVNFADVTTGGLTTIRQGTIDGCIYAMKGGYTISGTIFKICHSGVGIASNEKFVNSLGQNYPNPASGATQVDFSLSQAGTVTISLYDVTGRKVKTVLSGMKDQGTHTVEIDGLDKFANGSYFYKIEVKQSSKTVFSETKRMLIVK
jgi:glucose/arabinose dehydrogenase